MPCVCSSQHPVIWTFHWHAVITATTKVCCQLLLIACVFSEKPTYSTYPLICPVLPSPPEAWKKTARCWKTMGPFFSFPFLLLTSEQTHPHVQTTVRYPVITQKKQYSEAIVSRRKRQRWLTIPTKNFRGLHKKLMEVLACECAICNLNSAKCSTVCYTVILFFCIFVRVHEHIRSSLTRGGAGDQTVGASNWNTTALPTWDPAAPTCKGIMFYLFKQRVCSAPCPFLAVFSPLRLFGPPAPRSVTVDFLLIFLLCQRSALLRSSYTVSRANSHMPESFIKTAKQVLPPEGGFPQPLHLFY